MLTTDKPETGKNKFPPQERQVILDEIIERLSNGENLRKICEDSHLPAWTTIYNWANGDRKTFERLAQARVLFYDAMASDCLQIADDGKNDWMATDKGYQANGEHIQRSKLRIETRLKLLAKWDPERYGEKVTIGGDKKNPLLVKDVTNDILRQLSPVQLEQITNIALLNESSTIDVTPTEAI